MAAVFGEPSQVLGDEYLRRLLRDPYFWAIAAWDGEEIIGGVTAHEMRMTRDESSELFIYDVAVREEFQRRGVGRMMMAELRRRAAEQGIGTVLVAADDEDEHAIRFYRALGGQPSPVTFFAFADDAHPSDGDAAR